ncbi:MAG TPA: endonuclease V [Trueperaceae bacterium]
MELPSFPEPDGTEAARALQRELAGRIVLSGGTEWVRTYAALDASIKRGGDMVAATVFWDRETDEPRQVGLARLAADEAFPYIPGLLSFREAPLYLAALSELSAPPDLLLVDGQGIAHPRGLGIAAHLGLHLNMPSIGVAKSRLYGQPEGELAWERGSAVPLVAKGKQIGWLYRSRDGVKPLYVSPGHRVGMREALDFVRQLPGRTRLPEPLKAAHNWSGRGRREGLRGRIELPQGS